jgi:hypothetical protein
MSSKRKSDIWEKSFNACANSLVWAAEKLDPWVPGGMIYIKINVILFCILLPLVLAGLVGTCVFLLLK